MERVLFAPLTKVVEQADGTLEVWGRAAAQEPDSKGEVFDYEASKPFIKNWSNQIFEASGGKSLGNLRAMHNPKIAAGLITKLDFNDADQAVDVVARVVDAEEVKKTRAGVYTGFSIGGAYGPKRQKGNLVYYAAIPSELSLADNPTIKSARFTLVKVDGSEEQMEFAKAEDKPEGDYGAKTDAGYADPGLQADKKPRYPLKINGELSEKRIRAAWNYITKPKNAAQYSEGNIAKIKAKIIAAWKEKIDPEGPPSAAEKLHKAVWHVGSFADSLQNLRWLLDDLDWEAVRETEEIGELLADLTRAGARHTAKEMEQIQQIHDHAAALGAACQGGMEKMADPSVKEVLAKVEGLAGQVTELREKLTKVQTDYTAQGEQLAKMEGENKELKDRLGKVEAEPAAPKGALKAVGKGDDVQPLGKVDGPTEEEMIKNKDTLGLIKAAQGKPITV